MIKFLLVIAKFRFIFKKLVHTKKDLKRGECQMQKVLVPVGVATLLGCGVFFYSYMMSDEMVLRRLGYDHSLIQELKENHPQLVQDLIDDHRSSKDLEKYLEVSGFNYDCYDSYVELSKHYKDLETNEVVYLATFLDHVFFPTLLQQGYEEDVIKGWFSDPQFKTYVESVDVLTLNRLLNYAQETKKDMMTLLGYVAYEKENATLKPTEVVAMVDEYQDVVLPGLKEKGYAAEEVEKLFQKFGLVNLKALMETEIKPEQALELMKSSSFDPSRFSIYDEILSLEKNYSVTYALQYAKYPNVKSNFYQDIVQTPNVDSLLVLVNQNYQLAANYTPTDFVPVEVPLTEYSLVNTNYLRRDAADATELLFAKAKEAGYDLVLRNGYISYEVQKNLYDQDVYEMGLEYADSFNSRAGHSEHQTGLAIDITTPTINNELSLEFANTDEGKWVLEHAHEYGFILRYPENRESEVGYFYEPYHLRYVGVEVATEIHDKDWTLEDYILNYGILDQSTSNEEDENNDDAAVDRKDKQDDKQDQDKENVPNQQESENSPADKADDQQDSSAKPKEDESELGDNEDVSGESSREGDDSVDERNHPKEETPSEETPDKSQAIQEDDDLNSQEKYEL